MHVDLGVVAGGLPGSDVPDEGRSGEGVSQLRPIPNPKREDEQPVPFSHPAEEAFARILDFYQIPWEHEPTTFPLEWDEEGQVTNAFTPDFYLVSEDLYVELTTMRQSLVTKKNRKLRLLHALYPQVRCKLMYRRDVANLAVKYGLFDDVSAAAGQDLGDRLVDDDEGDDNGTDQDEQ